MFLASPNKLVLWLKFEGKFKKLKSSIFVTWLYVVTGLEGYTIFFIRNQKKFLKRDFDSRNSEKFLNF